MSLLRRAWPILLLVLIPLIPLWRVVFLGEAIGPFDQLRQMHPFNGPKPGQPWDVLQADGVLQFYPWRDLVFEAWGKGQLPFWNPYQLAGYPLLGNSQSAAFYPPHILMGILHVPTLIAMTLLAWFHLAWAGLGVRKLVKALGGTDAGGVMGGAAFSLSAFMLAWTGLPSVITTVSWIPWILACIVLAFDRHPLRMSTMEAARKTADEGDPDLGTADAVLTHAVEAHNAVKRHSRRYILTLVGLAASVAMMILGGHLQFAAYGFLAAGILWVWMLVKRFHLPNILAEQISTYEFPTEQGVSVRAMGPQRGYTVTPGLSSAIMVVLAVLAGVALSAPQLLPVLNYSQFSHRRNTPTEGRFEAYNASALRPFELIGAVYPKLLGDPTRFASSDPQDSASQMSSFWPQLVKPGANFAESAIALGPLVVAVLFCLRRKNGTLGRSAPMLTIGAFGLLLALGTPLGKLLYFGFPGWSSTGSPGRAGILAVLAGCVAAGIAASRESEAEEKPLKTYLPLAGIVVLTLSSIYGLLLGTKTLGDPAQSEAIAQFISKATQAPLMEALLLAFVTILCVAFWLKERRRPVWALYIPVLLGAFLATGGIVRSSLPGGLKVAGTPPTERIAVINHGWDIQVAWPALLPPNLPILSRIHDLGGYDSLLHRDTKSLLDDINGEDSAPPTNGNMMFIKPSADPAQMADAGVTQVWSAEPLPGYRQPVHSDGMYKYEIDGPGRASIPGGTATIEEETSTHVTLRVRGPGKLTLRDRMMPGWMAKVDRQSVPITGTLWREVEVPAGDHAVQFNYVPPGFMSGVYLAFLAGILLIVGTIYGLMGPKN